MVDARPLTRFLTQIRLRLNLIIATAKFMAWFARAGMITGFMWLIIRATDWLRFEIETWILLSLSGGFAGLVYGWRRRLDNRATAGWVDEHFKTGQLLSAALLCMGRECSGLFDERIISAAVTFVQNPLRVKWPVRHLLKQACLVAGLIFFLMFGALYWAPSLHKSRAQESITAPEKKTDAQIRRAGTREIPESPRTLAKMLFPEDVKMAILAERALREGDWPVLEDLLAKARQGLEQQLSQTDNPEMQRDLRNEIEQRQQLMELLVSQAQADNRAALTGERENGSGMQGDESSAGQKGGGRVKNDQLAQGSGFANDRSLENGNSETSEAAAAEEKYDPSDYISDGALKAGSGHNPKRGDWGEISAATGKQATLFSINKEQEILEYILPGKDVGLPLSEIIPGARRSAEAAIYREGIPYEYQEFISGYFLLLSQEANQVDAKEAQE